MALEPVIIFIDGKPCELKWGIIEGVSGENYVRRG